jgi:UDP-N-acetylmuramoylalanine--D-glutamate ligase
MLTLEREAMRGKEYREWLEGRRVAVVGLARSGLAACRLLRTLGAEVVASDSKPFEALGLEVQALEALGVAIVAGGHPIESFSGAELVVASPGVPLTLPVLERVRESGTPIIGELELAWRVMEASFIAITGTNGKTTTTALAGALLQEGVRPVLVGGNIGRPLSAYALDVPADGLVVAEVSSFQLETVERFHPRVAVLLNITPDHLDRHTTFQAYVDVKAKIFRNQTEADLAVLNADDPVTEALARTVRAPAVFFSRRRALTEGLFVQNGWIVAALSGRTTRICPLNEIPLRGGHNVENVLAATACALWAGITASRVRTAIAQFPGVEHRIERVREISGVTYYNDSKGTNVASTIKAIESFAEPVILIAGGRGKGQDFTPLAAAARGKVRRVILIGEDREKIRVALGPDISSEDARSMGEAVGRAQAVARPGEVVLLSPACASFDMFENFEHRGQVFKAAVHALKD